MHLHFYPVAFLFLSGYCVFFPEHQHYTGLILDINVTTPESLYTQIRVLRL